MLLLIDAGNTRIKWALAAPAGAAGAWLASGAVAHAQLDTLQAAWSGLAISAVLLSNVAGAAIGARLRAQLPAGVAPQDIAAFASLPHLAGVRNQGQRRDGRRRRRPAGADHAHAAGRMGRRRRRRQQPAFRQRPQQ